MYIPSDFQEENRDKLFELIDAYSFAMLISGSAAEPMISHVPLLLDRTRPGQERLVGHVARANKHWRRFDGSEPALVIFQGPHAYVSPTWYASVHAVPTWNYAVVHVRGRPTLATSDTTLAILGRLIERFEAGRAIPWTPDLASPFITEQARAIVGFELTIEEITAKFKLGQNRDDADQAGIIRGLSEESSLHSRELAAFMSRQRRTD